MKYAIALILLSCAASPLLAVASGNTSNDFGNTSSSPKPLSREDIAYRFHVTGEVFVVSADGEKLLERTEESRDWSFGAAIDRPLVSTWNYQHTGLPTVSLRHEWTIEKDGRISVLIRQYDKMTQNQDADAQPGKLLREQRFVLNAHAMLAPPRT